MDRIERMMFDLLRYELSGRWTGCAVSPEDTAPLFQLAKKHELSHLAADALEKLGILSSCSCAILFQTPLFDAYYRYERYQHAFDQLCQAFESAQIRYLPLKGLVLRFLYPEPWMRTSCDMDILVHVEDMERARIILTEQLQYQPGMQSRHDVSFSSADGVCVELHFDLVEEKRAASARTVLAQVWEYSHPAAPGQYQYVMADEVFFFYHIAHMAKHFEQGGCGIRSVLDLWLMMQHPKYWNDNTISLLRKGGLLPFANGVCALAKVWFENAEPTPLLLQMEQYILHGGIYGSADHRYAVYQSRAKGKWRYILSRAVLPRNEMVCQYPVLQKHRWLLPVCQIARWFSFLTGPKARARKAAIQNIQNITDEQVSRISNLLTSLEL